MFDWLYLFAILFPYPQNTQATLENVLPQGKYNNAEDKALWAF